MPATARPATIKATLAAAVLLALAPAIPASAQTRLPTDCSRPAPAPSPLQKTNFRMPPYRDTVRLTYLEHAEYLIEAGDITVVTDYTGYLDDPAIRPDAVTMNHAHQNHFAEFPDPAIPYMLQGWPIDGRPARYDLDLGALRLRNVTTDLYGPTTNGAEADGNSIFLFEAAGLCIGHLGHLHVLPTEAQYAAIGRLDVVMVPVDDGYTMDSDMMLQVLVRTGARIVLPMHWYSEDTLASFLDTLAPHFTLVETGGS